MTAELTDNIVKLKMDLPTFQNKNHRKLFQSAFSILLYLTLIIWLIVVSINVQSLQEHNEATLERRKGFVNKNTRRIYYQPVIDYLNDDIYTQLGDYGYFFKFDNVMRYSEGEDSCKDINGHIVEFDETDPNIQEFLMTLKEKFTSSFWIGLKDQHYPNYDYYDHYDYESHGKFKWEKNGADFSKSPEALNLWSKGEPDNIGSERCVATDPNANGSVTIMNVNCNCCVDPDEYFSHVICKKNS